MVLNTCILEIAQGCEIKGAISVSHLMVHPCVVSDFKPFSSLSLWCVNVDLFDGGSFPYRRHVPWFLSLTHTLGRGFSSYCPFEGFSFYNFGPSFPFFISTFILSYMVKVFRTYELIVYLLHVEDTSRAPF